MVINVYMLVYFFMVWWIHRPQEHRTEQI